MVKYNNYPLHECAAAAEKLMQEGADVYQKFTCGRCGSRQTMGERNIFYEKGRCEECGYETNLRIAGCNYMAHYQLRKEK